jgi:hypothetical protein
VLSNALRAHPSSTCVPTEEHTCGQPLQVVQTAPQENGPGWSSSGSTRRPRVTPRRCPAFLGKRRPPAGRIGYAGPVQKGSWSILTGAPPPGPLHQDSMVPASQTSLPRAVTKSGAGNRPDERQRSTDGTDNPTRPATAATGITPSGSCAPGSGNGPCAAVARRIVAGGTWKSSATWATVRRPRRACTHACTTSGAGNGPWSRVARLTS